MNYIQLILNVLFVRVHVIMYDVMCVLLQIYQQTKKNNTQINRNKLGIKKISAINKLMQQ